MHSFKLFVFVVCLVSCGSKQQLQNDVTDTTITSINTTALPVNDGFAAGKVIDRVYCKKDPSQSFALYIPAIKDSMPLAVIYFFDPHGDGALPLRNYQALASAYHFILIGSNNSKNGNDWNTTQKIWSSLLEDAQIRLPINKNRMYACGFSGGAKVAGFVAMRQGNIKGVIAAGAGLPEDQPIGNLHFSFTGMAGRGDMNMTDVIALDSELDKTGATHRIILFDGEHAWPPADAMKVAFTGLQLDAMREGLTSKSDSLVHTFVTDMNRMVDKDIAAQRLIEAEQDCALVINMLKNVSAATNDFVKKENTNIDNSVYRKQLQVLQQLFATEQKEKQVFQQQFQQGDTQYWTATINNLKLKADAATPEGAMYQRLLAYLSLAFYSISNNLINNGQNNAAEYFVTLYKMADPTNAEAWYFSAVLNARMHNTTAAEADLLKAAANGFTDTARMLQQPDFQVLSPQINFVLIESKMKHR